MLFALSFFVELFILFLLSRQVTRGLSRFLYRMTKSKSAAIYIMAFFFFPGTVIHELSHFFMASVLFVPTGAIDLWPKLEGDSVKLGSVAIAQTDPIRRFLIGMAPFLFGTMILLALLFYAIKNNWLGQTMLLIIIVYTLFEIGNTMFSSRKDMEGALELLLVLAFFTVVFYLLGFHFPFATFNSFFNSYTVKQVFAKGALFLLAPLGIDGIVAILLRLSV